CPPPYGGLNWLRPLATVLLPLARRTGSAQPSSQPGKGSGVMFTVHGTLKSSSPFIGYHVQAFFQEQLDLVPAGAASTSAGTTGTTTASTATWVASVRTADVAPSGSFSLSLPDADKVKEP